MMSKHRPKGCALVARLLHSWAAGALHVFGGRGDDGDALDSVEQLVLLSNSEAAAAAAVATQRVPGGQAPLNPASVLDEFGAVRPRKRGRHGNDRGAAVGALGRELQADTTTEFDTFVASAAALARTTPTDEAE